MNNELSEEEVEQLRKLLRDQPHITELVKRDQAYTIVLAAVKRLAAWLAVVFGALAIGWESIISFIKKAAGV